MSQRRTETPDVPQELPEEYRRSEFDAYVADLPYGSAWPGSFRVGAGALLLFFGAFLVFVIFLLLSPLAPTLLSTSGPDFPVLAVVVLLAGIAAFSLYLWSGLGRYMGARGVLDDRGREGERRP